MRVMVQNFDWPKRLRARLDAILKESLDTALEWWKSDISPEHFKPSAESKYGYEERDITYMEKKRRKWGHQLPLIWSGHLKDRMDSSAYSFMGTSKARTMSMDVPKYMFIDTLRKATPGKKFSKIDKEKELTKVLEPELADMIEKGGVVFEELCQQVVNEPGETTVIGG